MAVYIEDNLFHKPSICVLSSNIEHDTTATARALDDGVRGGRFGQGNGATDGDLQPARGEPIGYFLDRLPVGLYEDALNADSLFAGQRFACGVCSLKSSYDPTGAHHAHDSNEVVAAAVINGKVYVAEGTFNRPVGIVDDKVCAQACNEVVMSG